MRPIQIRALKILFDVSETVTCECGHILKPGAIDYRVLAARGCPKCGGRKFNYQFINGETRDAAAAALPGGIHVR